ncbi:MAG: hypothetical protein N2652_05215 [Kiritimatiellae bacterium]|nr:hypothetical protein [Kiritimatiellia bacterium]
MRSALEWIGRGALVATLAAFGVWVGRRSSPATPEQVVTAWFDAVARGDANAAMRLAAGPLRQSLDALRSEARPSGADNGVAGWVRGLRGVAVKTMGGSPDSFAEAEVELVFEDRNERQVARLQRRGRGWVIVGFSQANRVVPPVQYGTPAFD